VAMYTTTAKYGKWNKAKRILHFLLLFLSSGLYFLLAYIGYKDQRIDIKTLKTYTGKVISFGETMSRAGNSGSKVFYVDIEGLEQRLGVYRFTRDYKSIIRKLNIGDVITVYYKDQNRCEVNIDLVQIERNNEILLDNREYRKKESALTWIGFVGGFFSVVYSIWYFKRHLLVLFNDNVRGSYEETS
jgi:hypothetical protein